MKRVLLAVLAALLLAGCAQRAPKPAPAKFHPQDLINVTAVRLVGAGGVGTKTASNPGPVLALLQRATPEEKQDLEGTGNLVYLVAGNREIGLQYWPGNHVFDIEAQQFWSVPGLDEVITPLLPKLAVTLDGAIALGKQIEPNAEWWPRFVPKGDFAVDGDEVWLLVGFTPDGKRLASYVDPATGMTLQKSPVETTDRAMAALREFFDLMARGDAKAAGAMLHSAARRSTAAPAPAAAPAKITGAVWHRDYWKYYGCQCMIFDVVDLTLDDGRTVHTAMDEDGAWRLFWDDEGLH